MDGVGLERLASADVPPELEDISGRVLSRISCEKPGAASRASSWRYAATGVALVAGIAAGAIPVEGPRFVRTPVMPFDGGSALAPSSLLLGTR